MNASPLSDVWEALMQSERRALCVLAYLDREASSIELARWHALTSQQRQQLARAMRHTTELAVTCAKALHAAHLQQFEYQAVVRHLQAPNASGT